MKITTDGLRAVLANFLEYPNSRPLQYAPSSPWQPLAGWRHRPRGAPLQTLADLAKEGDAEALDQLYDHYMSGGFRLICPSVTFRGLNYFAVAPTRQKG